MTDRLHPLAGTPAPASSLIDVDQLTAAYADLQPDPTVATQRVAFGTSGHRGSSLERSFNAWHVLAISQAVCDYRTSNGVDGPLYLGIDTHALSAPAAQSVLEVLASNGVTTMIAAMDDYTPTPAVSHAILAWNRGRSSGLADGIVVTPSHNPPESGGIKYNASHGGPADTAATSWIQARANALLADSLRGVRRLPYAQAHRADTTHRHDYREAYVADLAHVVDLERIRASGLKLGVDPLGGAGIHYWPRIAEAYHLDLSIVNDQVDPRFAFMSLDWDGRIRMDPSSSHAMQRLIGLRDRFDLAMACDPDHDRHGIVTRSAGLLPANHYLAVMIDYLFRHRPLWAPTTAIGKTAVSTALIDRIAGQLHRRLYEVPVGFKWFVDGLFDGSLGIGVEESAGASFNRFDGGVWSTDKDGIIPGLLAAEITAVTGVDPGERYRELIAALGEPCAQRIDAAATPAQNQALARLSPAQLELQQLAGDPVLQVIDRAPGNHAAIGGIKVSTRNGWFAARPSGTEDIYKIYAESMVGEAHLQALLAQAQQVVDRAISEA